MAPVVDAAAGEIVGLRYAALPPPPGPAHLGSYNGRTLLDPIGVRHFTGMRVLGYSADRPTKAECEDLRLLPDGLDRLTGGTHGIVVAGDQGDAPAEDGPDSPDE